MATDRYTLLPCLLLHFFQKHSPLEYMHQCHNREWYFRVNSHVLEPLKGEQYWDETNETLVLPPKSKVAPEDLRKKQQTK